jgi:hypothetical protein
MNNPKFSKRHYEKIAQTIKESENSKFEVAKSLAEMLAEDNERFSFSKFAKACGLTI